MLQDLDDLLPVNRRGRCKVMSVMESLDSADREILWHAVKDTAKWSTHGLHVALRQKGVEIGYQSLYRHRAGTCSCGSKNA